MPAPHVAHVPAVPLPVQLINGIGKQQRMDQVLRIAHLRGGPGKNWLPASDHFSFGHCGHVGECSKWKISLSLSFYIKSTFNINFFFLIPISVNQIAVDNFVDICRITVTAWVPGCKTLRCATQSETTGAQKKG